MLVTSATAKQAFLKPSSSLARALTLGVYGVAISRSMKLVPKVWRSPKEFNRLSVLGLSRPVAQYQHDVIAVSMITTSHSSAPQEFTFAR